MKYSRRLHRWLGVALALPLLWLCVTGVLLNHGVELGLDRRMVSSPWLLGCYTDLPQGTPSGLKVGERVVSQWGSHVFLDDALLDAEAPVLGAAPHGAYLFLLTDGSLAMYDSGNDLLDNLSKEYVPGGQWVGLGRAADGSLVLMASDANYSIDAELLSLAPLEAGVGQVVPLPKPVEFGKEQREFLTGVLHHETPVSWSRLLLDAHKGAFLGGAGKWLLSLSTLGLMVLTFYGIVLLSRPSPRGGRRNYRRG